MPSASTSSTERGSSCRSSILYLVAFAGDSLSSRLASSDSRSLMASMRELRRLTIRRRSKKSLIGEPPPELDLSNMSSTSCLISATCCAHVLAFAMSGSSLSTVLIDLSGSKALSMLFHDMRRRMSCSLASKAISLFFLWGCCTASSAMLPPPPFPPPAQHAGNA
uniref:Uncharacterized protein n=1 Tax=Oryza brachyantha TaxID=4533 RepID=J3MT38_ORYBR